MLLYPDSERILLKMFLLMENKLLASRSTTESRTMSQNCFVETLETNSYSDANESYDNCFVNSGIFAG